MTPKNNFIILTTIKDEEQRKSGIIVPTTVEDKDTCGWADVYETCEGSQYKKGQRVIFTKWIPVIFILEDTEYWVIREQDVICCLD